MLHGGTNKEDEEIPVCLTIGQMMFSYVQLPDLRQISVTVTSRREPSQKARPDFCLLFK